jgi:hypothetical protein
METIAGLPYTNHHNSRSAHLTFNIPRAGVCHGFAGYFEAILYGDVGLSIHPERAAGDMLSWFPIFFPLMVRSLRCSSLSSLTTSVGPTIPPCALGAGRAVMAHDGRTEAEGSLVRMVRDVLPLRLVPHLPPLPSNFHHLDDFPSPTHDARWDTLT